VNIEPTATHPDVGSTTGTLPSITSTFPDARSVLIIAGRITHRKARMRQTGVGMASCGRWAIATAIAFMAEYEPPRWTRWVRSVQRS